VANKEMICMMGEINAKVNDYTEKGPWNTFSKYL